MLRIEGRRISLSQFEPEDFCLVYQWRTSNHYFNLCALGRKVVNFETFVRRFRRLTESGDSVQLVIRRKKDNVKIGYVLSYDTNRADGYTFVTVYLAPGNEQVGYGVETTFLMLDYLFRNFGLYKIYTDVWEYNQSSVECLKGANLKLEGRFRGHRLVNGVRHDLLRFAIYRLELEEWRKRLTPYFAKADVKIN